MQAKSTHPMQTRSRSGIYKKKLFACQSLSDLDITVPTSVAQALSHPKWKKAMEEEIAALEKNRTWTLTPATSTMNVVGNRWVFKIKKNPDGSTNRYKARLVTKGFHQNPGVDFKETFSPVINPCTIRLVLAIAVSRNWPISQVDINNAFLNGTLTETIFMTQPEGFVNSFVPTHVCHLHKSLYGLKQAPRAWYDKLKVTLCSWGFKRSQLDTSLFIFQSNIDVI